MADRRWPDIEYRTTLLLGAARLGRPPKRHCEGSANWHRDEIECQPRRTSISRRRFKYSPVDQAENIAAKRRVLSIMADMTEAPLTRLEAAARDGFAHDAALNVTHPINELRGIEAGLAQLWRPLRRALPDMERRENIVAGGIYREGSWVACMGHYLGNFTADLLGIPATRGLVHLRFWRGA